MRKTRQYVATLVFTVSTICSFSQRAELLVIGGLTSSIIRENGETSGYSRRYAPHLGFLGGYGSSTVMIQTGIIYSSQGARINSSDPFFTRSSALVMNFINVPVMVVAGPDHVRFFAGPQLSFLTSAKYGDATVHNSFEDTSLGVRYGFGFELKQFLLQMQFCNGLTDIYHHPDLKWVNNSYSFSVGYKLFSRLQEERSGVPHRVID
jgi:hypothetical protein